MSVTVEDMELVALTGKDSRTEVQDLFRANGEDEISSIYYRKVEPICWYSMTPCKFTNSNSGTYTPPIGYHYLISCYLKLEVPCVVVADDKLQTHRISWCHNLIHEIVDSAKCCVNQFALQAFDRHWLIMEPQFFLPSGCKKQYNRHVGNTKEYQTYSTILPRRELQSSQPWFYSRHSSVAFPLWSLNSQTVFSHNYEFNLNIEDMIRMKQLDSTTNTWKQIKPDITVLKEMGKGSMFARPTLHGCFSKIRDNEIQFNKCDAKDQIYYVDTTVNCDEPNHAKIGDVVTANLASDGVTKAVFWCAHNRSSEQYNIRSNYTTSWYDDHGDSPIDKVRINYGKQPKFQDISTADFNYSLVRDRFPRCPWSPEFYAFATCYYVNSTGIDVGIDTSALQATFSTKFVNPNNSLWINGKYDVRGHDHEVDKNTDDYYLIVRLLVTRKLVIKPDGTCIFTI